MKTLSLLASCLMLLGGLESASAGVIGFEDLEQTTSFNALGIVNNYHGFEWGWGQEGGVQNRSFVDVHVGWGSVSQNDPLYTPPGGLIGQGYALNYAGPQSLWIDFRGAADVMSIDAAKLSPIYWYNAKTIQLFGYDASDRLIGQTAAIELDEDFQTIAASFSGVRYLEIRTNKPNVWFSVDNLAVSAQASPVPLPGAFWLLGSALAGLGYMNKRRKV